MICFLDRESQTLQLMLIDNNFYKKEKKLKTDVIQIFNDNIQVFT